MQGHLLKRDYLLELISYAYMLDLALKSKSVEGMNHLKSLKHLYEWLKNLLQEEANLQILCRAAFQVIIDLQFRNLRKISFNWLFPVRLVVMETYSFHQLIVSISALPMKSILPQSH